MIEPEDFEIDLVLPSNIRELAYKHTKNYDISDYEDYLLHTVSCAVISIPNKESIMYELLKRYKIDYIQEWLKRLEVYDEQNI